MKNCSDSDSLFSAVFNNNQAIMLLIDPENNQQILDANEAALKFYGYTREEFLKLKMGAINTMSLAERQKRMKEALKKGYTYHIFTHITRFGVLKEVEVNASPLMYNNKMAMFIIVHDITVQKIVERRLRMSQERLAVALEGINLGIWDWWVQTNEIHVNKRWAEMIGYSLKELAPLTSNTWRENTHPDDVKLVDEKFQKHVEKGIDVYNYDARMKHKDGSWVWIESHGKVVEWSDDGKPLRVSGTNLDITQKKMTELRLEESEAKYRSYFEGSPLSLWEQDYSEVISYLHKLPFPAGEDMPGYLKEHPEIITQCTNLIKVLDVNPATLKLYDARNKEVFLRDYRKIFTEESFSYFRDKLVSLYNSSSFYSKETIHKTLRGTRIYVRIDSTLLSDFRSLITITDITELKRKESELNELLKQTRADAETKDILLREINHRVKNNLSSLIGILYTELRKSKNSPEKRQLDLLNNLINRVKGISIAHELLSRSAWKPISIKLLSERIIHSLGHLVPPDRSIVTKITSSPIFLDSDQSHSMAVIINELFVNSIEHAAHPGEEIEVSIIIKEENGEIIYKYKDTGPGFSEDLIDNGSNNVGLYLVKNIITQSLRGSVSMENRNGAMVIIRFPGGSKLEEL